MTLALLCFQKQFLRQMRRDCDPRRLGTGQGGPDTFKECASKAAEEMKRVLPRHAVSLHIAQEWRDTLYLLEAAKIYGPNGPQLEQASREVRGKYDAQQP
jgi:hypothetical protein